MSEANVWTPHLRAGERVLWQASVMESRYLAERSRQRMLGLFILAVALIAGVLFGASLAELLNRRPSASYLDLSVVFLAPIYIAAILACLAIAAGQVFRFNLRRPAAAHYAVTSARLLAVDGEGALVDQLEGGEIAAAQLSGPDAARNLTVRPKPGELKRQPFAVAYAEGLAEAKSLIDETFLANAG
jgi:hypothetical protein